MNPVKTITITWRLWAALLVLPFLQIETEPNRLVRLSGIYQHSQLTHTQQYNLFRYAGLQASNLSVVEQLGWQPNHYALHTTEFSYKYISATASLNTFATSAWINQYYNKQLVRAPPVIIS